LRGTGRILPFATAFGLFVLWSLFQVSGWGPSSWWHPVWQEVAAVLGSDPVGAIALSPIVGLEAIVRQVIYGGVFWLAFITGRERASARALLWALALAGMAYAAYGLVIQLGGFQMILFSTKWAYLDRLSSSFVNPNNYATYAGLGLLCCLALLLDRFQGLVRSGASRITRLIALLDELGFSSWLLLTALVTIGTALVLSASRGGLISAVVGIIALGLCMKRTRQRRLWWGFALGILVAAIGLFSVSGEGTRERSDNLAGDLEGRLAIYGLTVEQILERPLLGSGPGSFRGTFYAARDASFGSTTITVKRAHNSYLEVALEAGLPAFALLLFALGGLVVTCAQGVFRRRSDLLFPSLGLAASLLIGLHALVDFSLQIPAISVTYAVILGIAVAQSRSLRDQSSGASASLRGSESAVGGIDSAPEPRLVDQQP